MADEDLERQSRQSQNANEVEEDDEVVILESMKMEIPIESIDDGTVVEIRTAEGASVKEGDVLLVLGD